MPPAVAAADRVSPDRLGPVPEISFNLNGTAVVANDDGCSLLEALRDQFGVHSVKDGCSPQGQCGCCTVWVDGSARVACVTPLARVRNRSVTTLEGIAVDVADEWGVALCNSGGSQCGFCTPGIVMRLEAVRQSADGPISQHQFDQAMLAHLCRCTGWQTIREAAVTVGLGTRNAENRVQHDAQRRARLEGGSDQVVHPDVALGRVGFADDIAPPEALVAMRSADGEWVVGESVGEVRRLSGKVQGRRTTVPLSWPVEVPEGNWDRVLRTTWLEPAYLEPDASWCLPGGEPVSTLRNAGAFGGKVASPVMQAARELADQYGRPVRVLYAREDVVRRGPKRPPLALGVQRDGAGAVRVVRTPGIIDAIRAVAPSLDVVEVDVPGPPTSVSLRAAGWAEVLVALASLGDGNEITAPNGARASARIDADGSVHVWVNAGEPLDDVVLRSYCIGAAHMALGWVRNEGLVVDDAGEVHDLTIRSFGVLRAVDTPSITVDVERDTRPAVNGSDAVFAAVAVAAWRALGFPPNWPLRHSD